jgi:D-lactate dehydrogenase
MRVALFSTHQFDRQFFDTANRNYRHQIDYLEPRLTSATAALAAGAPAVCAFVGDTLDEPTLRLLASDGTRMIALRSAGFNNVDLPAARRLGLTVARVPAYSPHSVAEHTVALILTLNRKIHRAHARVREGNFSLDGLLGFDLNRRTVGIVGTGKIGAVVAEILHGFGCRILAYDVAQNPDCVRLGARYVPLDELWAQSDIITLHTPLTAETRHMVDASAISHMKPGVMIINTGRGGARRHVGADRRPQDRAHRSGRLGRLRRRRAALLPGFVIAGHY